MWNCPKRTVSKIIPGESQHVCGCHYDDDMSAFLPGLGILMFFEPGRYAHDSQHDIYECRAPTSCVMGKYIPMIFAEIADIPHLSANDSEILQ
jgi:hypothetical protein